MLAMGTTCIQKNGVNRPPRCSTQTDQYLMCPNSERSEGDNKEQKTLTYLRASQHV